MNFKASLYFFAVKEGSVEYIISRNACIGLSLSYPFVIVTLVVCVFVVLADFTLTLPIVVPFLLIATVLPLLLAESEVGKAYILGYRKEN